MASNNKTYIQKAIDKTLKQYESPLMGFQTVEREDITKLREKLMKLIAGNEGEYLSQINDRLSIIEEKLAAKKAREIAKMEQAEIANFGEVIQIEQKVKVNPNADLNNVKLQRDNKSYKKGVVAGGVAVACVVGVAVYFTACGNKPEVKEEQPQTSVVVEETTPVIEGTVEEVNEKQLIAEEQLRAFATDMADTTSISLNALLANGVRFVDYSKDDKDVQKDLIAGLGLQYVLVANIDDITTLEYANFMKEQHGAVVDNDDLINNFRRVNDLFKDQMLVCTPDNKIDFANIYKSEADQNLLNGGADILARYNAATKLEEKKAISKEFYDYIATTILDNTDKFKYSNSAMATFINSEFKAWAELTKSSGYKKGYYPDDELEAKLMTVVSQCGLSKGEASTLDIEDETKRSLESINVTRITSSLAERKENIMILAQSGELFYVDEATYGVLKDSVIASINLDNYKQVADFTKTREAAIKAIPSQKSKNDSGVSNGQGGTVAKSEFEKYGIDPASPTAREEYETKVVQEFEKTAEAEAVIKNNSGQVIDENQAAAWAQQGVNDALNGTSSNVPSEYKDAYSGGYNAQKEALSNFESSTTTTFVPAEGPKETVSETITVEDFTSDIKNSTSSTIGSTTSESTTTFVPITDGEITETVVSETFEGFVPTANAPRTVDVKVMSRDEKLQSYQAMKDMLAYIKNSVNASAKICDEIEELNMTK